MHYYRRLLDRKQLLLTAWDSIYSQNLSYLGDHVTVVTGAAVRCASERATEKRPSVLQQRSNREQRSAELASGHQNHATQSDARVQQYPGLQRLIQSIPRNDDRSAFPLGLFSAASASDEATIALQSGVNLAGPEMGLFQGALSSTLYPQEDEDDRMYPAHVIEDIQMEVLRRNNISMPCKKNQRVYGTVYAVDRKRVWINVGHDSLAQLSRSVRRLRIEMLFIVPFVAQLYPLAPVSWDGISQTFDRCRSCS